MLLIVLSILRWSFCKITSEKIMAISQSVLFEYNIEIDPRFVCAILFASCLSVNYIYWILIEWLRFFRVNDITRGDPDTVFFITQLKRFQNREGLAIWEAFFV